MNYDVSMAHGIDAVLIKNKLSDLGLPAPKNGIATVPDHLRGRFECLLFGMGLLIGPMTTDAEAALRYQPPWEADRW